MSQSMTMTTTTTKTTTKFTKSKSAYDDMDIESLIDQLSAEEIEALTGHVDPDDTHIPPAMRSNYKCQKEDPGELNRDGLMEHIVQEAINEPDREELVPYEPGKIRGKKWIAPKPIVMQRDDDGEIGVTLDLECENALAGANEDEIVDLAAILGFHSMMNQDQYHASMMNKELPHLGWGGITKATKYTPLPLEPDNSTDPEESIKMVLANDQSLIELNWNNIRNISDEKFKRMFKALRDNTMVESISMCNVGLRDYHMAPLIEAMECNNNLRVLSLESNFITPRRIADLIKALNACESIEEFRACNQKPEMLGNKIEMEIASTVEKNPTILRLGIHLEYNNSRDRVAKHLQANRDKLRMRRLEDNV